MSKKCIHFITIRDKSLPYQDISLPMIRDYAKRIGADLNLISERKFPDFPVFYELVQIHERGAHYDWNLYFRPGCLLGNKLFDVTSYCPNDAVSTCFLYSAKSQFVVEGNIFFERDIRDIGISDIAILSNKNTHDIWEPLPGPYSLYKKSLRDEDPQKFAGFTLSHNLAKYGIKVSGMFPRDAQYDHITEEKLGQMPIEEYVARRVRSWRN